MDQELHGVAFDLFSPSIDAVLKVAARQNGAWPHHQGLKEGELSVGELNRRATIHGRLARGRVK
jgi:hypothetical protein